FRFVPVAISEATVVGPQKTCADADGVAVRQTTSHFTNFDRCTAELPQAESACIKNRTMPEFDPESHCSGVKPDVSTTVPAVLVIV
ncbi:hypothetical protein ABTB41_19985, partial [Acinetobacter baumannii]